jgi:uncharacterized protein (TIGR02453 family)
MTAFEGFPPETLAFLKGLRANNTKAWFDAHRAEYEAGYVEPAKRFVAACGEALAEFAPRVQAEPRVLGSIFRINRDTRFSKDKTPYKDHLDLRFWEGERKAAVSGFFVRITPDLIGSAADATGSTRSGWNGSAPPSPTRAQARSWRESSPSSRPAVTRSGGAGYKRPPAGYTAADTAKPLLLHKALFVHHDEAADDRLGDSRVLDLCVGHWRRMAPLHRWLVANVQSEGDLKA